MSTKLAESNGVAVVVVVTTVPVLEAAVAGVSEIVPEQSRFTVYVPVY